MPYLGQNLAHSESCPILRLLLEAKICNSYNLSKNGYVWATQWPTSNELKIKSDPSIDRSWCEFLKILKYHEKKKIPLPPPHAGQFSENFWQHNCSVVKIVHGLVYLHTYCLLISSIVFNFCKGIKMVYISSIHS